MPTNSAIPRDTSKYSQFCCPNPQCSGFEQFGAGHITHRSWTGKNKQIERLRCTLCDTEFSERKGTLMEYTKLSFKTIETLLKCQRWGVCDEGTADICCIDLKTVHRFQRVSAARAKRHHDQVVQQVEIQGVQMDEMHSKGLRGEVYWLHTAIDMTSRFLLWFLLAPRDQQAATALIAQVVARVHELPMWFTDGWKAYEKAFLQVLGRIYQPVRKGLRGRHPKPRLMAPDNLYYGQVIKVRDGKGKLVEVVRRVVFEGSQHFFEQMSQRGLGRTIHTSFMERWYGTLRGWCAVLRRRTRCVSTNRERHEKRVWLLVDLYNFVLTHGSLTQEGVQRTPAMALGLVKTVWSYTDYIWYPVHLNPFQQAAMAARIEELMKPALEVS